MGIEPSVQPSIRVLVADDHPLTRSGLALFLAAYPDLQPVGEATSGDEALTLCEQIQPDVVLMDMRFKLGSLDGIAATAAIKHKYPRIQVIGLSALEEQDLVAAALSAGAFSYVLKTTTAMDLIFAIRAAYAEAENWVLPQEPTQYITDALA